MGDSLVWGHCKDLGSYFEYNRNPKRNFEQRSDFLKFFPSLLRYNCHIIILHSFQVHNVMI